VVRDTVFGDSDGDYDGEEFSALVADAVAVQDVRFTGCRFDKSSLVETVFRSCVFDDCSFTDCNLSLIDVVNSRFSGTGFERCKLTGVNWSEADWSAMSVVEPLRFSSCILDLSVFMGLTLDGVVFGDCSLREVDFSDARLCGSDFSGSDLGGARFSRTDLRRARLESAHGYGISTADNTVRGMRVSLPEAVSLLSSIGVELVERIDRDTGTR
jgi:uncharacterized protein YjbI with pentapeptide repeats